jgi:Rab3 GTPase-activating protein catalytic subunit
VQEKGAVAVEDSKNLFTVKHELKNVAKSYCMEFYFQIDNNGSQQAGIGNWNSNSHDLQLCFGVKDFLLIAPQSASGVLLDTPESSKLLSAVAIALSNCGSLWPAFVPVHDPSRKAYIGIQNMGTVFTRRFEADRVGSQVPVKLMHLEGLYELFVSKFVSLRGS